MTIVAVGMFDSPHFGRWLAQFSDSGLKFVLIPSSPHRRVHPTLASLLKSKQSTHYSTFWVTRYVGLPLWLLDKLLQNTARAVLVRIAVRRYGARVVHALEIQNAGYIVLKAFLNKKVEGLRVIVTNYGSDIYWFQRFPRHKSKIQALLGMTDYYAAECSRDVELARKLGFRGEVANVVPNAGGLPLDAIVPEGELGGPRTVIAIKGYHGWVGRAHNVLRALDSLSEELRDYQIVFFSCNWSTLRLAAKIRRVSGLDISCFYKGRFSHDQMLQLFRKSIIYVGASESDGISTSMIEAMSQGAIPVQTSSSCANEWIEDSSGVTIRDTSVESIAVAILKGLEISKTPEAAAWNRDVILRRATTEVISSQIQSFYAS